MEAEVMTGGYLKFRFSGLCDFKEEHKMANIYYKSNKAQTLTRLLRRINQGDNPELLRKEAYQLLTNVGPEDIATAEQNLINDGYSAHTVQLLSATFMLIGITENQSDNPKSCLPANHLVRMVMAEHDLIRYFLADLNSLAEDIGDLNHLTNVGLEFRRLAHIVEHLVAMKEHIEREDDIIFPCLTKYGRISLCRAAHGDHIKITNEIDDLASLIVLFDTIGLEQFKTKLITTTCRLWEITQEHLYQEDFILYPIALGIINDAQIWEEMKAVCDEIGYCGIHP